MLILAVRPLECSRDATGNPMRRLVVPTRRAEPGCRVPAGTAYWFGVAHGKVTRSEGAFVGSLVVLGSNLRLGESSLIQAGSVSALTRLACDDGACQFRRTAAVGWYTLSRANSSILSRVPRFLQADDSRSIRGCTP